MTNTTSQDTAPSSRIRLGRIDIARGIALITMAVYHFGWDLEFFGYMAPGTTAHGGWKLFARCIA
ncbi:heparan-alpha-glucosaminide N-acetyltransferase domain-containing protein, partial [Brucella intermedia]|uniref:heparan-alpha-glucosaminide N-acetyltransferase domain-containing protein n=2 Tax=Brucellaceae TaxID=118882 RepID=UPI002361409C